MARIRWAKLPRQVSEAVTVDLPLSAPTKEKLRRLLLAKTAVSQPAEEFREVLDDIDESLRDPDIPPEVKELLRDLRADLIWLNKWTPTINRMNAAFQLVSEFGVQMASTIIVGILLMGLLGWTFSAVVIAAFLVFVVIWWFRYQILLVTMRKVHAYARHAAAIFETPQPPPLGAEQLKKIRGVFLTRMGYFAISLLLVLFFTARILGTSAEILGIRLFDTFLDLLSNIVGNIVLDLILLGIGGGLGIYAKLKERQQEGTA